MKEFNPEGEEKISPPPEYPQTQGQVYYYGNAAKPFEKTNSGLNYMCSALLLAIIGGISSVIAGVIAISEVSSSIVNNSFIYISASSIVGALAGLLLFIAFIIGIIALYKLYQGRNDYGQKHAENMDKVKIAFIVACVVYIVAIVVTVVVAISSFFSSMGDFNYTSGNLDQNFTLGLDVVRNTVIVSTIFSAILAFFTWIILAYPLKAILPHKESLLKIVLILFVIGPLIGGVMAVAYSYSIESSDILAISSIGAIAGIGCIFSLIGNFFLWRMYSEAQNKTKRFSSKPANMSQ